MVVMAFVLICNRAMTDVQRFSLSPSRISLSTVGVVPRLRTLAQDAPGVSLALSLHAPTQELRMQIVPTAKAWNLESIMEAVDFFVDSQSHMMSARRCKVLIEYVLIADVNDSDSTARDLGLLLQPRPVLLNIIPYNPTSVTQQYKAPPSDRTHAFCEIVRSFDVVTIIRQELGQDIAGACGQLVVNTMSPALQAGKACAPASGGDIEDLYGSGKTSKAACAGSSCETTASKECKDACATECCSANAGTVSVWGSLALVAMLAVPFLLAGRA
jgi:hypothetical protein